MTQRRKQNSEQKYKTELDKTQPLRATDTYFRMTGTDTDVKIAHKLTQT